MLNDRFHDAFDSIQASERLKRTTLAHIRRKTFDYGRHVYRYRQHRRRLAICSLALVLMLSGTGIWFVPAASIAVDINPSVELTVNALDRVISLAGKNTDGILLAQELDVVGMPYDDAMQRLLLSNGLQPYLDDHSTISITVTGGSNEAHTEQMLSRVLCRTSNIAEEENVLYCQVNWETRRAAQSVNLCVPRYLAWQHLLETDPNVTPDEVARMDKAEIRALAQLKIIDNPCGE